MSTRGHSLGTRTLRGMFWAYGSFVGGRVLVLASTAVLARLLTPEEFGLVALALIFIALLETLSSLGVTQALIIAEEDVVLERAETAFVFAVAVGAALTLVTAALGPLAAAFFDEPELVALLPVLGSNFLLRSLGSTHYALAQKRIDFRSRTAAELADVTVRGVTGIALALAGLGVWSLVLGYLAGTLTLTAVLWAMVPWRPALRPRRDHLRQLLGFGGTLTAVDVVAAGIANVDYVMVGRFLGTASLGLYTVGFRLPELLIVNLSVVAAKVLFPAFAAVKRSALGEAFLTSLGYTMMVALPLTVGLAILAEPVTLVVFGDQWRDSISPMQVITLYALAVTIGIPAGTAYKAIGRADVLLKLAIPRALLLVAALILFVDRGLVAVAACQAGVAALFAAIGIVLASRLLQVGGGEVLRATWAPVAAAVGMAAVVLATRLATETTLPSLLLGTALGGATYLALLWLLARDALVRLKAIAFPAGPPDPDLVTVRETDVVA